MTNKLKSSVPLNLEGFNTITQEENIVESGDKKSSKRSKAKGKITDIDVEANLTPGTIRNNHPQSPFLKKKNRYSSWSKSIY